MSLGWKAGNQKLKNGDRVWKPFLRRLVVYKMIAIRVVYKIISI